MAILLKKRGREGIDIIAEVLKKASVERVKKTSILYEVGMSYKMLGKYLRFMIDAKLLEEVPLGNRVRYRTSDKGKHFLRLYHELMVLLASNGDDSQAALKKISPLLISSPL